jgi:ABC-type transporter Mla maintaining outer membrane lipid asymmetry ATPase subunit MlaF
VKKIAGAPGSAVPVRELSLLHTITGKQCNEIVWSPAGGIVAIAYLQQDSALFDFFDVDNNVTMASRKHERCVHSIRISIYILKVLFLRLTPP